MDVTIACVCPVPNGTARHPDGDTVTFRDRFNFQEALAIRKSVPLEGADREEFDAADILAFITERCILRGIVKWTVADAEGKPLPVSHAAIRERILENPAAMEAAGLVAETADKLYGPQVLLPLLALASNSSPPTPTEPSTSRTPGPPPTPAKRSRRSSTSTSPTDAIAATSSSLAGVSSSSPSSTSA